MENLSRRKFLEIARNSLLGAAASGIPASGIPASGRSKENLNTAVQTIPEVLRSVPGGVIKLKLLDAEITCPTLVSQHYSVKIPGHGKYLYVDSKTGKYVFETQTTQPVYIDAQGNVDLSLSKLQQVTPLKGTDKVEKLLEIDGNFLKNLPQVQPPAHFFLSGSPESHARISVSVTTAGSNSPERMSVRVGESDQDYWFNKCNPMEVHFISETASQEVELQFFMLPTTFPLIERPTVVTIEERTNFQSGGGRYIADEDVIYKIKFGDGKNLEIRDLTDNQTSNNRIFSIFESSFSTSFTYIASQSGTDDYLERIVRASAIANFSDPKGFIRHLLRELHLVQQRTGLSIELLKRFPHLAPTE